MVVVNTISQAENRGALADRQVFEVHVCRQMGYWPPSVT